MCARQTGTQSAERLLPHFRNNKETDAAIFSVDTSLSTLKASAQFTQNNGFLSFHLFLYTAELKAGCICLMGQLEMCCSSEEIRQTWWEALQGAAGKGLRKSNWC